MDHSVLPHGWVLCLWAALSARTDPLNHCTTLRLRVHPRSEKAKNPTHTNTLDCVDRACECRDKGPATPSVHYDQTLAFSTKKALHT